MVDQFLVLHFSLSMSIYRVELESIFDPDIDLIFDPDWTKLNGDFLNLWTLYKQASIFLNQCILCFILYFIPCWVQMCLPGSTLYTLLGAPRDWFPLMPDNP